MKCFLMVVTLILCSYTSVGYGADISAKICKVMELSLDDKYSPEELCDLFNGSFCSDMKTMEQAVCAANGKSFCYSYENKGEALCEAGGGSFCSSMKSIAGGICAMLNQSFCTSLEDNEEYEWKEKLAKACYWNWR